MFELEKKIYSIQSEARKKVLGKIDIKATSLGYIIQNFELHFQLNRANK